MKAIQLKAEERQIPTPKINQTREEGKIPAVLYGDKQKNKHLFINQNEFEKIYRESGKSGLIDLELNGSEPVKVLINELQMHPVTDKIIHIDFSLVKMGVELQTKIPLVFIGESKAVKELSGTLVKSLDEVEISCLPKDLIAEVKVDISVLETFNEVIRVSDLKVPENVKITTDVEKTVATVMPVKVVEEPVVEEPEEGEEGEEAAEGEEGDAEAQKDEDDNAKAQKGESAKDGDAPVLRPVRRSKGEGGSSDRSEGGKAQKGEERESAKDKK